MTDNLTAAARSKVMASIKGKDTSPELIVRKRLWAKGKRYRIHDRRIPGTPDISSFPSRIAVFIDGCFWHGCNSCYKEPSSRAAFWRNKLRRNKERRKLVRRQLRSMGFHVLEFWEHKVLEDPEAVAVKISQQM